MLSFQFVERADYHWKKTTQVILPISIPREILITSLLAVASLVLSERGLRL